MILTAGTHIRPTRIAAKQAMNAHLEHYWRRFREGRPGRRFQERYRRRQRRPRPPHQAWLWMGAGLMVIATGLVLLVMPGPGWLVIFIGASLLAGESLLMARLLDRAELKLRRAAHQGRRQWRRSGRAAQVAAIFTGLLAVLLPSYLALRWLLEG